MRILTSLFVLSVSVVITAPVQAEVSIQAPESVSAGAAMRVSWSGAVDPRDFVTIAETGAAEGHYGAYKYAEASSWDTTAPEVPGSYEIRYLAAAHPYATQARRALVVTAVSAELQAPLAVPAGGTIEIAWTGPDNPRDFITIVEAGAAERAYGKYAYTSKGNPAQLPVPEAPGAYEVRYLTGAKYFTLASAAVTVGGVSATLQVPPTVGAGSPISVTWTGPDNQRDFITIVEKGAEDRSYGQYAYTKKGSPVNLPAPDQPGEYEIRYLTGGEYHTLASAGITVSATTATVKGPGQVKAGESFAVSWSGPDNERDFIAIAPRESGDRDWVVTRYTRQGNPARLTAPLKDGSYELRYQTGQTYSVLAGSAIEVAPAEQLPGKLRVVSGSSANAATGTLSQPAVEVILDASGSMLKKLGNQRRIDIAKSVLEEFTTETLAKGSPFALRVFGHKEVDSCRTDLELPLGPLDPAASADLIGNIQAMNLAKTPIAASLEYVARDLAAAQGERVVILITDGEETCGGEPAAAIEQLRNSGFDVRVNIVGFAIDDDDLKQAFHYWAAVGGGKYFDAETADQLGHSVTHALRAPYDVLTADGEVVAAGLVNGEAVELAAGEYSVQTREQPPRLKVQVVVEPDSTATVTLQ